MLGNKVQQTTTFYNKNPLSNTIVIIIYSVEDQDWPSYVHDKYSTTMLHYRSFIGNFYIVLRM